MSNYDYDLFVIGAGSGGVRCARIAAGHGAKVAIAEKQYYGGTCVNVGCVPKKLMTYLAGYAENFEHAKGYGWNVGETSLNWQTFIQRKDAEIQRLNSIYECLMDNTGVTKHWGHAKITDPHCIEIEGKTFTAKNILIATGGRVHIPASIENAEQYGITSDDVFYLKKQPKKMVILGAGYIALEFASIFNTLGTEVDVIFRRKEILYPEFDDDLRCFLDDQMTRKGVRLHPETNITKVEKEGENYNVTLTNDNVIQADQVLFATGRKPNTDNIGAETVGIELGKGGEIIVNKDNQTNIPSIYAVGDVIDRITLTPVALGEGHALADRLFGGMPDRYISYENVPTAVFSNPNLAYVGLTESEACDKYGKDDIDIFVSSFRSMKTILAEDDTRSMMKIIVRRSTDKVLGVKMIGAEAGEIVQGFATAMIAGATKADFDRTIGIHPTVAEEFVTMRKKTR